MIKTKIVEKSETDFFNMNLNENEYMALVQSKDNLQKCRQFINDLFVASGGEQMKFVERVTYIFSNNLTLSREIHFIAEQSFSIKHENLVNSMNKKIEDSTWKTHELMRYFKPECVIQVGQKLEALPDLEKLNGDKKIRSYVIEEGKAHLIYLWTIYKSICKKQLKLLEDLFESKRSWESSVKFVSINTDLNRDYAKKMIKILGINKMENLYVCSEQYPNHPLFNVGNKYGYPVCVLVNNDNIIEACGSLYDIDLEKKINFMLNRDLVSTTSLFPNTGLNDEEKNMLKKFVKSLETNCENYKPFLKAPHLCGATLKVKKIMTAASGLKYHDEDKIKEESQKIPHKKVPRGSSNEKKVSSKGAVSRSDKNRKISTKNAIPLISRNKIENFSLKLQKSGPSSQVSCELDYFCHVDDEKVLENIFIGCESINKMKLNINFVETYAIPLAGVNSICARCEESLACPIDQMENLGNMLNDSTTSHEKFDYNNDVTINSHFYCANCKVYFCKSCGDKITDLNFPKKVHPHFLYYLHPKNKYFAKYILAYNCENSYEFDFKYFQENNKTTKYVNDIKFHFQVKCDGCLSFPIKCARWKCCNCIYKNLCNNCKNHIENKDEPFYEDIMYNFRANGCDPAFHVFIKIIFDSFVY